MGARHLSIVCIASISMGIAAGTRLARAQGSGNVQELPPIEVSGPKQGVKPGHDRAASRPVRPLKPLKRVFIYPTTPLGGADADPDKVPASINAIDAGQIKQTGSLNISDALVKYVPGITINEVSGNPFTPNVQFRGFVASPVSGTPQGLAVYQNGVRINEAFGDTVNWDLIPTAAIKSVTMVTNNPAFGLNALGGAVDMQMKDGFSYHGAEIDTMGGSFGRIQSSAQWGKQIDNYAVYGALEGLHDDGFRNFQTSNVRRFYGDV
ncbi:MAG TPA: Plug domain-containing protein, partial [Bradyrhizobium sp.]|nr:Plug domain-containing protein [Bradyrhizobium sp.]